MTSSNLLHLLIYVLVAQSYAQEPSPANSSCTAFNNASATDWLVTRCGAASSFTEIPGGFILNNSIVSRTFRTTCDTTIYTESLRSEASGSDKIVAVAPEATFLANGITVLVGGLGGGGEGVVQLKYAGYRLGVPLERYPFSPGQRGSHVTAWPPAGIRVSIDHTAPCMLFNASNVGVFNATVSYELYDSVPAFGKSIAVTHNCSGGGAIKLLNLTTDLLSLASVRCAFR